MRVRVRIPGIWERSQLVQEVLHCHTQHLTVLSAALTHLSISFKPVLATTGVHTVVHVHVYTGVHVLTCVEH